MAETTSTAATPGSFGHTTDALFAEVHARLKAMDARQRARGLTTRILVASANRFGVRDLGAYEMQSYPDRIFADSVGDPVRVAY